MRRTNKQLKKTAGRRPKTEVVGEDTRSAILTAARKVFAARGLSGTAMREVAETAGVNNAMIYYHFKDKDDLYRAVLLDSFSTMIDIWNDPVFTTDVPVRRKLEKYVEAFIRFQSRNEELRRIMAMEFAGSGGKITGLCEHYFGDNFTRLAALFKEGMKRGELKKVDPSLAVASLIGIIIHNFLLQPLAEHVHKRRSNLSPGQFGSFVTDLVFDGLAARTPGRLTTRKRAAKK